MEITLQDLYCVYVFIQGTTSLTEPGPRTSVSDFVPRHTRIPLGPEGAVMTCLNCHGLKPDHAHDNLTNALGLNWLF